MSFEFGEVTYSATSIHRKMPKQSGHSATSSTLLLSVVPSPRARLNSAVGKSFRFFDFFEEDSSIGHQSRCQHQGLLHSPQAAAAVTKVLVDEPGSTAADAAVDAVEDVFASSDLAAVAAAAVASATT